MKLLAALLAGIPLLLAPSASAVTAFSAVLSGAQEVPPVTTAASGSATLSLNDAQDRLTIAIQLNGLDLDGNQTPADDTDDVVAAHVHNAPPGVNGGVVFGFIGPNDDTNGDLAIDPVAGTIESAWDASEGSGTTLDAQLASLFAGDLYLNVHTTTNTGGEIRGQIVPEPGTSALLGLGLLALGLRSRPR